jgi:hypothetical protein
VIIFVDHLLAGEEGNFFSKIRVVVAVVRDTYHHINNLKFEISETK